MLLGKIPKLILDYRFSTLDAYAYSIMTIVAHEETDSSSASVSTESRAEVVYIVTAIITLSSLIVFALRLFIRCVLLKTAGPDDWTMLIAEMFAVVAGISTFIGTY